MKLYANMALSCRTSPSSAGVDAVGKAYDGLFSATTLSVNFDIVEICQLAPDWAFARTNSAGAVDAALKVDCDGISGEVELRPQRKFADDRLRALAAAVNAERVGGFPSGRLFLDSAAHPSNFVADRSHHVD